MLQPVTYTENAIYRVLAIGCNRLETVENAVVSANYLELVR